MNGMSLAMQTREILKKKDEIAFRQGRNPKKIRLLAVSKGHSSDLIRQANVLGLSDFGENYYQEWKGKVDLLSDLKIQWHFIGHLQSNKVNQIVGKVSLIHSVDSLGLAQLISQRAQKLSLKQNVLVEINFGEETKSGISPVLFEKEIFQWSQLQGINLCGLMVLPPLSTQKENSRIYFKKTAQLLDQWRFHMTDHSWDELSMGTSHDYEIAIEEGATIFRVGTALFGPRT
ncbi:MAG: YggS family pyridoxal phosphate-dependent enzyme [Bdellovibrionales bacterium]|nr:YggS family pyridoxal phosphate-dependent enzyme [Bdellovibrionales bacterium]